MQKNINLFFSFGCPNLRGGGGGAALDGTKDQIFPMSLFEGSPNDTQRQIHRYRSTQVGSLCSSVYLMYGPIVAAALSKFGPSSNLF